MQNRLTPVIASALLFAALPASATVSVIDDAGQTVSLAQPARRVVSLAPHVTEMLFAAGGGDRIVGTVNYSDYPPQAREIARVGDNKALDLERIAALRPDLIVVWRHGNAQKQADRLRALGIPLFYSEPRRLAAIPDNIEKLGTLLGTEATARRAADGFRQQVETLRKTYAARPPVTVFYQVWQQPLMTLNGQHLVSDMLALCGGRNLFAAEAPLVPTVSVEAVIAGNPEAMVTAGMGATRSDQPLPDFEMWRRWKQITAVARNNLFVIDGDLLNRAGPRVVQGAAQLCKDLDTARSRRPAR
ncbi:cobalamin binding periplasmic transporter [Cupriavidus taiwanensis]|uniref:Cobalamin binding periplasmic transporter n=1 Tax=Cupriavidus taiwanensis TaxID=164546 RepID=A0A375E0R6_9BURK|nr:cobalamin-binding protein [Cupriavidus taiwanensis]SOZ55510.1 cobalamin binding periplasmic transporter [Cupriavidus taiwanensis]SOZ56986.1 cobalamin binding periplasmic transporter [Cupriavidus taiwanensis]SOZ59184.1 cobalamin binding periplasmic transporter [Cupriavidus taiwanensis]SPA05571.1 cobalamin binding periplasmic transporter [Cupriavidus taiwanensis]SPA11831.1 cobalamin binding periplasmic transporter [Cupriavidus taiwanensis]